MVHSRRNFLQVGAAGMASASLPFPHSLFSESDKDARRYKFTQIDVFTANKLEGNQLAVFHDAHGLSDEEMQNIARETNLQETTFVFPRDAATEREHGIKVRIFVPQQEIPFGGHPTLGTSMVLRNRSLKAGKDPSSAAEIALDLKVGKIPLVFRKDESGHDFGEMRQIDPVFGKTHNRETVAALIGIKPSDISEEWPIQSISTGLQFAIVPLRSLNTLQSLKPDQDKIRSYFEHDSLSEFYYITSDTRDPKIALRSRAIYAEGEDAATGSASGCVASWMVRYGVAKSGQAVHILQGVEMKRPSHLHVRADKIGDKVTNVRVGGNAVEVMEGEYRL